MLRCRDIVELLDDYLDGRLDAEGTRALESHLNGCQDCAAFGRYRTRDDVLAQLRMLTRG